MNNQFDDTELAKSKTHIIMQILEYVPNSVLTKILIKKNTGNVSVSAVDAGEELAEKTLEFDSFVQIIDGAAELMISGVKFKLILGEGIIIPAHSPHWFKATEQFKMMTTLIKSGYEE